MKKRLRKPYVVSQAFFGVQTFMRVVDGCLTTEQPTRYPLLEQILSPANLNTAYRQVVRLSFKRSFIAWMKASAFGVYSSVISLSQ